MANNLSTYKLKKHRLAWLVLFTTGSTLVCCALPIILVSLGFSAALVSIVSISPWIEWLSNYDIWVLSITGLILLAAAWSMFHPGRFCPLDPNFGKLCAKAYRINKVLIAISIILWFVAIFVNYILHYLY
jgi:hypothetical protein